MTTLVRFREPQRNVAMNGEFERHDAAAIQETCVETGYVSLRRACRIRYQRSWRAGP
jgi:hypothetical protein